MTYDLNQALKLLKKKAQDYASYKFSSKESMAIFAFFDLTQEFVTLNNLYRTAVAVIKFFFKYESCIQSGPKIILCCFIAAALKDF